MNTSPFRLNVVAETDSFFVVDKPCGQSVHNDSHSLLASFGQQSIFPVHRLDRETSGLLLLAKNKTSAQQLQQLFVDHQITKLYRAVVYGKHLQTWPPTIVLPISDKPGGLKQLAGPKPLRPAQTDCQVVRANSYFTELQLWPRTGLTHQLRKHCALLGASLVGDRRYSPTKSNARVQRLYGVKRMLLHAESVQFCFKDQEYLFESTPPPDFTALF